MSVYCWKRIQPNVDSFFNNYKVSDSSRTAAPYTLHHLTHSFCIVLLDITCSSKHAVKRIALLLIDIITGLENNHDDDDVDLALSTLLHVLLQSKNNIDDAKSLMKTVIQAFSNTGPEQRSRWSQSFLKLAQTTSMELVPVAVPLSAALLIADPATTNQQQTVLYWELLLKYTSTIDKVDPQKLLLASTFFDQQQQQQDTTLTTTTWNTVISPSLLQKFKAQPEKTLQILPFWLQAGGSPTDEWAQLLVQHPAAHDCIHVWCQHSPSAAVPVFTHALLHSTTTTLLPVRQAIYETMKKIAAAATTTTQQQDGALVNRVLEGLVQMALKETKSEPRLLATAAMLQWWSLSTSTAPSSLIDFMRECLKKEKGNLLTLVLEQLSRENMQAWLNMIYNKNDTEETLLSLADGKRTMDAFLGVYMLLEYAKLSTSKTIPKAILKHLSKGTSFLYKAEVGHPSGSFLPRILALYLEMSNDKLPDVAYEAIAKSIALPSKLGELRIVDDMLKSLKLILDSDDKAAACIIDALLSTVNSISLRFEALSEERTATRAAREAEPDPNVVVPRFDGHSVRRSAILLLDYSVELKYFARGLLLMHAGSSLKVDGHQRAALLVNTRSALQSNTALYELDDDSLKGFAEDLLLVVASEGSDDGSYDGDQVQNAGLSLLVTLGQLGANFNPDVDDMMNQEKVFNFTNRLCVSGISPLLANTLSCSLKAVSCLTEKDIAIYLSERGTLYGAENEQAPGSAIGANASRRTEDQEWEIQIRKEMLERKKASTGKDKVLSEGELKTVKEQDLIRERIKFIHKKFLRVLGSIRYLCISDIETGNRCLPTLALPVLVASIPMISDLPFVGDLRSLSQSTLEALCGSVFEIHEAHAPTLAKALVLSCTVAQNTDAEISTPKIEPISLPTACAAAACAIHEMDTFGDTLSPPSFFLLFPILQAALKGPRTPTGCDGALRVLSRHLTLLSDNGRQSFLSNLRPDILSTVLELLRHDRAQTFHSPSPFDVVCNCFDTGIPEPKTSDLLPLLDERGALGTVGCRKASVMVLNVILDFHPGILQKNPLVESRIWVGCFDDDEDVKTHAVKAWIKLKGNCQDNALLFPPSPSFSLALLPLLGHSNAAIAASSALAYANAISLHPDATKRNLEKLFKTYIDSFPAIISDFSQEPSVIDDRSKNQAPEKKPLSLGLPKKKSVAKKSALDVAGIGRPKVGKGKKKLPTLSSDILKPKKERTMDKETLESQFIGFKKDPDRKIDSPQKMMVRKGVLSVLRCMNLTKPSFQLDESSLKQVTLFLTAFGMADVNEELQSLARDTLRDTIASNGGSESTIEYLLALLENVLHTGNINVDELQEMEPNKVPTDVASTDFRKQGAVVALGSIALHLKGSENESKVDSTVNMLVSALETPSEDVQTSVADALTKLMKKGRTMDRVPSLVETFINGCFHGKTLALRRGSAYGLAATVKGGGIGTLKKLDVIQQLDEACSSGDARAKEGSLFAMELLSDRLGLLFEPYVINLLPSLLRSFSDGNDHVRNAATNTAALIMSKLSAHGVKLVLPAVLASFNDAAWRTKQASISMLGSMSHLAPKQLASALPKVVPKLIEAFSDTHPKVKQSAEDALKEIGKVVKNPEISSLSPTLLKALTNPSEYTSRALESLIETEFLHSIDSPSLALIVPILHRGLRDRWATNKRCGALIAGNICTMINDPSDFSPYLPTILPDLQVSLLDPIPDVRNSSAKALGSLVRSLGNSVTNELRPWLSMKLRDSSCSSAERSGAAQGLTEVLIASGSSAIEDVMHEEIFPLQDHPDPCTREGILWMLTFLPQAMGQNFSTLLNASLPVLITGLSDDSETVRDVAMRAGRVMIKSHGKVHVDTILPYLEKGLIHDDHRIRMSSLSLLGDLLSMIGGTQVHKSEGDTQDDFRRAEKAQAQISLVLGPETRRRIYSELFLARNDAAHSVRSSAVQVWKTIVSVTARTLRDILPVLVDRIVSSLASGQQERILVAGKTLGDLVSKLGDSVFPQIIPVLRSSLYEGDRDTKRGVCVGMNEILKCSTKDQIAKYLSVLVKLVQDALSDEDPEVRSLASESFQSLHELVGNKATEEIIPSLMVALEAEDSESVARSINGLSAILSVKSRDLLPYIIPRLIASPITEIHAVALSRIAEVTGSSLNLHFGRIVTSLLNDLSDFDPSIEGGRHGALQQCVSSICESLEAPGVPVLISEVASKCASDKVGIRRESCRFFEKIIIYRKYFSVLLDMDDEEKYIYSSGVKTG